MLKFKNLTFDEQNYWGLIFLAKCIDNCSDLTEMNLFKKVIMIINLKNY